MSRRFLLGLFSVVLCALVGCTFAKVKPEVGVPPPNPPPEGLVVGTIQITDERISESEKGILTHAVWIGISGWTEKHGAVLRVSQANDQPVDPKSIAVSGTISQVHKGSQAMRLLVGMGAGQAKIEGEFEVKDAEGKLLSKFTARRSYLGGSGAGGLDMVSMEDLARQLGQSVGETIAEWVAGKNLEKSSPTGGK